MGPPADHPAPVSVTRAFVVQLRAEAVIEQGRLAGRVAHVVSGQATNFESLETLLACMARVLRAERRAPQPSRDTRQRRTQRRCAMSQRSA